MKLGPLTTAGVLACAFLLTSVQAEAKKGKRRLFTGHGVKSPALRTEPVPKPSGEVWVYSVNFREELKINIYRKDAPAPAVAAIPGKGLLGGQAMVSTRPTQGDVAQPQFDDEALASLDHIFRCKRTGETRAVDPRLYQTLSVISDHFGGKRIELISGFRFQREEGSRHYHASAMDIRIPGVSLRELRDFADSLDTGGMGIGIYPRAGWVHVDWRAPGEPSYRWTDRSSPHEGKGKRPSRRWKKRPQS
jgi:hypothetical protein